MFTLEILWSMLPTETLKLLQRLLKSPGCRKIPVLVQNKDDVIVTASNFSSERYFVGSVEILPLQTNALTSVCVCV